MDKRSFGLVIYATSKTAEDTIKSKTDCAPLSSQGVPSFQFAEGDLRLSCSSLYLLLDQHNELSTAFQAYLSAARKTRLIPRGTTRETLNSSDCLIPATSHPLIPLVLPVTVAARLIPP